MVSLVPHSSVPGDVRNSFTAVHILEVSSLLSNQMWFLLIVLTEYVGPFQEARVLFKAEHLVVHHFMAGKGHLG